MARSNADDDYEHIAGDGDYAIEVVSGSRHQDALEWLGRGRGENPTDYECTALLVHEPDNPFDPNAVSVTIFGVRVGYLPPDAATRMNAAMQTWGFDRATCEAIIEGGWYRNADDKGDFCVLLDANPDFTPEDIPLEDHRPLLPVAVVAAATAAAVPPPPPFDLKSMVIGALATFAMFLLIGFVWLVAQPSAPSVSDNQSTVAPATPMQQREVGLASPDAAREKTEPAELRKSADEPKEPVKTIAAPVETRRDPKTAGVAVDPQSPAAKPATSRLTDLRSSSPLAEAVRDRLPMPSPAMANAPPLIGSAVAFAAPAREVVAATPDKGHVQQPTDVTVVRKLSAAAAPPMVAEEVGPALRRKRSIDAPAASVVHEIHPPLAAAIFPPALPAVPAPAPQVARAVAAKDNGEAREAPSSSPAATSAGVPTQSGAGDRRASAPPDDMIRQAPPAAPVVSDATPDTRAGPATRRLRANVRLPAESRAARAHAKSRSAVRYGRRTRLAVQPEPSPSAPRPNSQAAGPQIPMATRMFEGWAREWAAGAALPPLGARRPAQ